MMDYGIPNLENQVHLKNSLIGADILLALIALHGIRFMF